MAEAHGITLVTRDVSDLEASLNPFSIHGSMKMTLTNH
jgi:hypothetical protein